MRLNWWKRLMFFACCSLVCLTLIAPMTLGAVSAKALSEESIPFGDDARYAVDNTSSNSLQIHDRYGDSVDYYIYSIAEFSEDGQAFYADSLTSYGDELQKLPGSMNTAADEELLTSGLLKLIKQYKIQPTAGPFKVDSRGYVSIANLSPGYYLVVTSAAKRSDNKIYSASPILVAVTENVQVEAKSQLKTQTTTTTKKQTTTKKSTTTTKPSKTTPEKLPKTGVLWWPVPVLFAGGIFLYGFGVVWDRKRNNK